jgi:hypothetical protein
VLCKIDLGHTAGTQKPQDGLTRKRFPDRHRHAAHSTAAVSAVGQNPPPSPMLSRACSWKATRSGWVEIARSRSPSRPFRALFWLSKFWKILIAFVVPRTGGSDQRTRFPAFKRIVLLPPAVAGRSLSCSGGATPLMPGWYRLALRGFNCRLARRRDRRCPVFALAGKGFEDRAVSASSQKVKGAEDFYNGFGRRPPYSDVRRRKPLDHDLAAAPPRPLYRGRAFAALTMAAVAQGAARTMRA